MIRISNSRAFTLVEMLVVIGVLSIAGVLILTIFSRSLQGGNKSKLIGIIKQNGQSVLEQVDKTVRNSDNVVCASSDSLITVKNGVYTRYRFLAPNLSNPPIVNCRSSNGCLLQDNPTKGIDVQTGKEETDPVFVNRVCSSSDTMSQTQTITLTDTNPQTGVSTENFSFTRDKLAGSRDQVTIKFDLKPGVSAPQALRGQIDAITFQTTIGLR